MGYYTSDLLGIIDKLQEMSIQYSENIEELDGKNDVLRERVAELEKENKELSDKVEYLEVRLKEANKKLVNATYGRKRMEWDALIAEQQRLMQKYVESESQFNVLVIACDGYKDDIQKLQEENKKLKEELQFVRDDNTKFEEDVKQLNSEKRELEAELEDTNLRLLKANVYIDIFTDKKAWMDLRNENSDLKRELTEADDLPKFFICREC